MQKCKFENRDVFLGIFRLKIRKTIVIFRISTLEMQENVQNKKIKSMLGPKLSYFGILGCKFEKVLSYLKSTWSSLFNILKINILKMQNFAQN